MSVDSEIRQGVSNSTDKDMDTHKIPEQEIIVSADSKIRQCVLNSTDVDMDTHNGCPKKILNHTSACQNCQR